MKVNKYNIILLIENKELYSLPIQYKQQGAVVICCIPTFFLSPKRGRAVDIILVSKIHIKDPPPVGLEIYM